MVDIDINQFYDSLAEDLASTFVRNSFDPGGFAQYYFWCPHTWTKHPGGRFPKLGVNFQLDVFNCWVCKYSGKASALLHEKGLLQDPEQQKIYDQYKISEPTETTKSFVAKPFLVPPFTKITHANYKSGSGIINKAYKYVSNRLECSIDFIEEFEIAVSDLVYYKNKKDGGLPIPKENTCIFFPSFGRNLELNYYFQREFLFGRSHKFNAISEKSKIIAFESRIDWNKKNLVLVEGGFDSLKLWSLGIQNVPMLGKSISKNFLLYKYLKMYGIEPVIFLDQEATEDAYNAKYVLQAVGRIDTYVYDPYDDIKNEYPERLRKELDPALLKPEHLLRLKEKFDV